ncbi:KAP family NTPase [Patescibacteria group bacterium]|nr:KAP family NTPase [Patescibacteria group bacterium]
MFQNHTLMKHNDLPITHVNEDKLKFKPFVDRVAQGIKSYEQDECFVISIEGEWGIGKTSFVNLVKNEIKSDVELMHFNPWLISNIEQLVSVFFGELIKAISHISFKTKLKTDIAKDMKAFLSVIVPDQVSVGVSEGNKATWRLDKYFKPKDPHSSQTLYEQKEKINEYLRDAEKRIVVVIDDIDRLMDQEVELIFRLIKGIADFDNITYVLLFDREVVSRSLVKYKAEKGGKYLDKVIQYPLTIPQSHTSTIIKLLTDRLDSLLVSIGEGNYHFDEKDWGEVYRLLGRYFKNVRDVNKVFDAFSFEYTSISKDVNFVDFFVITLIRLHVHELYLVIKNNPELFNYSLAYTILGLYGSDDDNARQKEIIKRIKDEYPALDKHMDLLQTVFPVFNSYGPKSINGDHKRKSIGDQFYFDNYFSMTVSADKLSFDVFHECLDKLINEIGSFDTKVRALTPDQLQQFFEMYKAHTSQTLSDDLRMKIIQNLAYSMSKKYNRDFRNDKTYAEFSWIETSWMDVVAEEILKLNDPKKVFYILEDPILELQQRCYLRYRIEHKYQKNHLSDLDALLEEYKSKHAEEIKAITIDKLLEFQFLDELLFCSGWLEVNMAEIAQQFKDKLFESQSSFFKILEKFIYKHVSMPRPKYPYSIQKSALKMLVEIEVIQKYIGELESETLSDEEQELLKYWGNNRDY